MMRLSARFRGVAKSGVVNCQVRKNHDFCYKKCKLPHAPHPPQLRGFRKGNKTLHDLGEILYNPNLIEPHLAMEIIERVVRLSLINSSIADDAVSLGNERGWEKDTKDEDIPNYSFSQPRPMWNGAQPKEPLPWDGGAGAHTLLNAISH